MSGRSLIAPELREAQRVFGDSIAWSRVRLIEDAAWPRRLAGVGARLRRQPPPAHNAVTLGHQMYFSRRLETGDDVPAAQRHSDLAWLIHELTHVWQYERLGLRVLQEAAGLHLRPGVNPYDYGGEAGLTAGPTEKRLSTFNVEQQADIARDYYFRLATGQNTQAWEPFVRSLRRA